MVSLLDAVADGVIVQETNGQLVHANAAAAALLGFATPKDLLEADGATVLAHFELFDAHLDEVLRLTVEWFVRHFAVSAARDTSQVRDVH